MRKQILSDWELSRFCEQYALILKSGISGEEGLQILLEESEGTPNKELFSSLLETLETDGNISQAFENSGVFPEEMIAYTKVGEETGCLDEVMASLSDLYEQKTRISSYIKSAVSYPLLMLGMMTVVIVLLLSKVLPVFQQVFRQMGMEMDGISTGFLAAGNALSRNSALFLILLLLLAILVSYLCFTEKGQKLALRMADRIPGIRRISQKIACSRAAFGLSLGVRSGLGTEGGLSMALLLNSREDLREKLEQTQRLMEEGESFPDAIVKTELFQGMAARMISVGVRTGSEEEVLKKISETYEEEAMDQLNHLVSTAEPTIVIVLSLMVGLVLLSVMMPLLGILSEMMI